MGGMGVLFLFLFMGVASAGTTITVANEGDLQTALENTPSTGDASVTAHVTTSVPTSRTIVVRPAGASGPTDNNGFTLIGNGPGTSQILGQGTHTVIDNTGRLGVIRDIEISDGKGTTKAGGLHNYGGTLNNVTFQRNRTDYTQGGGAAYLDRDYGGNIINGSKFNDNHADNGSGGAIYMDGFYRGLV